MSNQKERSSVYEKLITKDVLVVLLKDRTKEDKALFTLLFCMRRRTDRRNAQHFSPSAQVLA